MINTGLKSYTKQLKYTIGQSGEAYVNLRKNESNLILNLPIINTGGENPINISLIYNHQEKNRDIGYGNGLKLNYCRELVYDGPCFYTKNCDGTIDYFYSSNNYYNSETCETLYYNESDQGDLELCTIRNKYQYDTNYEMQFHGDFPTDIKTQSGELQLQGTISNTAIYNDIYDKVEIIKRNSNLWNYNYYNKINGEYGLVYMVELYFVSSHLMLISTKVGTTILHQTNVEFYDDYVIVYDTTNYEGMKFEFTNGLVSCIRTRVNNTYNHSRYTTIDYISDIHTQVSSNLLYTALDENGQEVTLNKKKTFTYIFNKNNYDVTTIDPNGISSCEKYDGIDKVYESRGILLSNNSFNALNGINLSDFYSPETISVTSDQTEYSIYSPVKQSLCNIVTGSGNLLYNAPLTLKKGEVATLSLWIKVDSIVNPYDSLSITLGSGSDEKTYHLKNLSNQNDFMLYSFGFTADSYYSVLPITLSLTNCSVRIFGIQLTKTPDGTTYKYNDKHDIIKIEEGRISTNVEYDEKSFIKAFESSNGITTDIKQDGLHRVTSVNYDYGVIQENTYHHVFTKSIIMNIVKSKLQNNEIIMQKTYTTNGKNVEKEFDPFRTYYTNTFDDLDRLYSSTDGHHQTTSYRYDKSFLKNITNNLYCVTHSYDKGIIKTVKAANDCIYEYTYDAFKRVIKVTMNNSTIVEYEYDDINNIVTKINNDGTRFKFYYNETNQLCEIVKIVNNVTTVLYLFTYDGMFRLVNVEDCLEDTITTYVYDYLNNIKEIQKENCTNKYVYNEDGELIQIIDVIDNKEQTMELASLQFSKYHNPSKLLSSVLECDQCYLGLFTHNSNIYGQDKYYQGFIANTSSVDVVPPSCLKLENYAYFDGDEQYKLCYKMSDDSLSSASKCQGTVGFYFYATDDNNYKYLFNVYDSTKMMTSSDSIQIYRNDTRIIVEIYQAGTKVKTITSDVNSVINNAWNYFGFSWYLEKKTSDNNPHFEFVLVVNKNKTIEGYEYNNDPLKLIQLNFGNEPLYCIGHALTINTSYLGKIACLLLSNNFYLSAERHERFRRNTTNIILNNVIDNYIVNRSYSLLPSFSTTTKNNFNIIPLHTSFKSIDNIDPIAFENCYSAFESSQRYNFVYDNDIKSYSYYARGNDLKYHINMQNQGTIAMKFKTQNIDDNRTLFQLSNKISLYISKTNRLFIKCYNTTYNTLLSISENEWHNIACSIKNITIDSTNYIKFKIVLDGVEYIQNIETDNIISFRYITVGRLDEGETYCDDVSLFTIEKHNDLSGFIEYLCLSNSYIETQEISQLFNEINGVKHISEFDDYGRLRNGLISYNNHTLKKVLDYSSTTVLNTAVTSNEISKETITFDNALITERTYSYDVNGMLSSIIDNVFGRHTYAYNQLGYLTLDRTIDSEGNIISNTTYSYDLNGNILTNGNNQYAYDSTIKDKIISINGSPITYENASSLKIKSYLGLNFEYEGNRLIGVNNTNTNISLTFKYDENGLRTQKILSNGNITNYYYSGDRLASEINSSYRLDFLYDENNMLIGFTYSNTNYFYLRDVFQNILEIIDTNGNVVVKYSYDAYGKLLSTTGSLANTIGIYNPFRYKGYYYDVETGLFMMGHRYYSPELCRFIHPDDIEYLDPSSINGLNLYCYCHNNPIMYVDPTGHFAILVFLGFVAISAIAGAVDGGVTAAMSGQDFWKGFAAGAIGGAVGGVFNYFLPGAGNLLGRAASTMIYDITNEKFQTGKFDINNLDLYVADTFMDVVLSMLYLDKVSRIANPFISAAVGGTLDAVVDIIQMPLYFTTESQERIRGMSSRNISSNSMYVNKCIYAY